MYVPSELRLIGKLSEDPVAVSYAAHDLGGEPALLVSGVTPLDPADLEAYTRWAELLVSCAAHPQIADVVSHGVVDGHPYLAVRTGKRRTLAERLSGYGPLPYEAVRLAGVGLADGLATAHDAGLRHLAIRPSAIFVGDDDGPVLVGFDASAPGLVRPLASGPLSAPEYHIPRGEIGGAGLIVGPPADVYALACCLYLALGGVLPWGDRDDAAARAVPLPELTGVPPALLEILRRAVAVHPAHRPTAAQLRDALAAPPAPRNPVPGVADDPVADAVLSGLPGIGLSIPLQVLAAGDGAAPPDDAAERDELRPLKGVWQIAVDDGGWELLTVDERGTVTWAGNDETGPFVATGHALPLGGGAYRLQLTEPAGTAGYQADLRLENGGVSFLMDETPDAGLTDAATE